MNSRRFLFCFVISFLFVQSGFAQPASEQPAAQQEEQPPAVVAQPEGDQEIDPLKEQVIYVPYEKLPQVFEKPARGVFLPYEQFQQLWDAARKNALPQPKQGPPLRSLITSIESVA